MGAGRIPLGTQKHSHTSSDVEVMCLLRECNKTPGRPIHAGRLRGGSVGGQGQNRTADPRFFRPVLFQLSYLAGYVCRRVSSPLAGTTGFEPATSGLTGRRELQTSPRPRACSVVQHNRLPCNRSMRAPKGIRIPVAALKGRSPRPLDDGGSEAGILTPATRRSANGPA